MHCIMTVPVAVLNTLQIYNTIFVSIFINRATYFPEYKALLTSSHNQSPYILSDFVTSKSKLKQFFFIFQSSKIKAKKC